MDAKSKAAYIKYEMPEDGIARIVLNRPDTANAQDTQFLYELNDAFDRAAHDDNIRVIILAANGKHFSSGHDLAEKNTYQNMANYDTVAPVCGFTCAGGGSADEPRRRNLHRLQRAMAQHPEAHDRGGPG